MKILVRRQGALGDVLCITPVLARLRAEMPGAMIAVETAYPQIFYGMDLHSPDELSGWDRDINLNLAYERRPNMHVVDAYFEEAFGDQAGVKTLVYKPAANWASGQGVLIHAALSWPSRTFTHAFWDNVAAKLAADGLRPVFIGNGGDYGGPDFAVNAVGKLSLDQSVALISKAKALIGSDSSMLHFAGTTETPIVGLYTCARAAYRLPYRHGVLGWNAIGLEPDLSCIGCLARMPVPSTNVGCERGDNICSRSINPEAVIEAVQALLAQPPA